MRGVHKYRNWKRKGCLLSFRACFLARDLSTALATMALCARFASEMTQPRPLVFPNLHYAHPSNKWDLRDPIWLTAIGIASNCTGLFYTEMCGILPHLRSFAFHSFVSSLLGVTHLDFAPVEKFIEHEILFPTKCATLILARVKPRKYLKPGFSTSKKRPWRVGSNPRSLFQLNSTQSRSEQSCANGARPRQQPRLHRQPGRHLRSVGVLPRRYRDRSLREKPRTRIELPGCAGC